MLMRLFPFVAIGVLKFRAWLLLREDGGGETVERNGLPGPMSDRVPARREGVRDGPPSKDAARRSEAFEETDLTVDDRDMGAETACIVSCVLFEVTLSSTKDLFDADLGIPGLPPFETL